MINFCNHEWTTDDGSLLNKSNTWMWYDDECVFCIEDGTAELIALHEPNHLQDWKGNFYNPTVACGMLRSVDTFGYGRFSAEIQLPKGKNLWPAFWLVGSGEAWPAAGEIDICEAWTPYFRLLSWRTTNNAHWLENGEHIQVGAGNTPLCVSKNPTKHFIKYEVEWRPNTITFYVNSRPIRCYGWEVAQHLLNKKMRVIFDLWTTGEDFRLDSPMRIKNFEFKPIETL